MGGGREGEITTADIEAARAYPIGELVGAKGNRARCPFHEGAKNLSASVTNNLFCCFVCGASGDSIDVARRLWGVSFPDAVRILANGG